jgi:glycosyltransferase involved in cell wall biosynthesis
MRVELLLETSYMPTQGGGYTLLQEIIQSLILIKDSCPHVFILINPTTLDWLPSPLPPHFESITVRATAFERAQGRIIYLWKKWTGSRWPDWPVKKSLKEAVSKHRIDCALSLIPGMHSRALPNIVTTWDLEHRRKAYFPEVSAEGEWERREALYRWLLPRSMQVITGTETGKQQIQTLYGVDPSCVTVIPFPIPSYAVEDSEATGESGDHLPEGVSAEFVFYPAQYWPHKNHVHLLQALKILKDQYGWEGMLVCCGADKGNLEHIKKCVSDLGLQRQTHLLDFVKRSELTALYRNALALTFVSYFGPDNLPPLEAFAFGCPVIASSVEGVEETVGDAALLVDPDDPLAIANAIQRLRDDSVLRKELISRGSIRAQARQSGDIYAKELLHLLDSLERRFECWR